MTTNEDLARAMESPPSSESDPLNLCLCGERVVIGWVAGRRVRICLTGDHVVVGVAIYVHVENPADVIEGSG